MPHDLVSLGLNAVDVLIRMPPSVRAGDKQMVDDLIIQGGAPTASGACGVARMGYNVAYVARLGTNTLSAICLEEFRNSSVSTDLVVHDDRSRPAIALVQIDPATSARTVFIQMDHYGFLQPADIPVSAIRESRTLLVDSYDLDATECALRAASGTACRTVLDFESGDRDRLRSLLQFGTDAILPLAAAQRLTDETDPAVVLGKLASLTEGQVIVTDGIDGSWALDRGTGDIRHQAAFRVESVDSTGCGDAYHAGYIVGVLEGWPLPLRMEFGSLLASHVARTVGGRTSLPWRRDAPSMVRPEVSTDLHDLLLNFK